MKEKELKSAYQRTLNELQQEDQILELTVEPEHIFVYPNGSRNAAGE
jgi:hypothetical protein